MKALFPFLRTLATDFLADVPDNDFAETVATPFLFINPKNNLWFHFIPHSPFTR